MPTNKDFKRLVRARMRKTGESYTAARAHLLDRNRPLPKDCADRAGMSDDAVRAKTGRTWPEWTRALDAVEAAEWPHRRIADWVSENHEIDGWWAQTVAVGYERIRGLREIGQRRGGAYDASKSRTVAAPLTELYRAWIDEKRRAAWLPGIDFSVRTATEEKSMRLDWPDGHIVAVYFTARDGKKSQVSIQHLQLPSAEATAEAKAFWGERLDALAGLLAGADS